MTDLHPLTRRATLLGLGATFTALAAPAIAQTGDWKAEVLSQARAHEALRSLIVARDTKPLIEEVFSGAALERGVNVKSVSKTILSSLVGIAIANGLLEGPDQPIAPLLRNKLPDNPDPRLARVTIGNLLSMQSGLERTSGQNYGRWVQSRDWVRFALDQPFVDEPGGRMLYSTGNTHLLSAILTRVADASTLEIAREWLGKPRDITVTPWPRDPQGVYFGGNDMLFSPRALMAFGEMYRADGKAGKAEVVRPDWITQSWTPRTSSPWTGHDYGYGWFLRKSNGFDVRYAWGYGGQMLFVVPQAGIVCTMISDPNAPSGRNGYVQDLHALFDLIVARVTKAA